MRIVATGTWLYGDTVRMAVHIVRLDYDFWYEIVKADGDLEPGELPDLNDGGHLYYVAFREPSPEGFWPDSQGFKSIDEAKASADARVPGGVAW